MCLSCIYPFIILLLLLQSCFILFSFYFSLPLFSFPPVCLHMILLSGPFIVCINVCLFFLANGLPCLTVSVSFVLNVRKLLDF